MKSFFGITFSQESQSIRNNIDAVQWNEFVDHLVDLEKYINKVKWRNAFSPLHWFRLPPLKRLTETNNKNNKTSDEDGVILLQIELHKMIIQVDQFPPVIDVPLKSSSSDELSLLETEILCEWIVNILKDNQKENPTMSNTSLYVLWAVAITNALKYLGTSNYVIQEKTRVNLVSLVVSFYYLQTMSTHNTRFQIDVKQLVATSHTNDAIKRQQTLLPTLFLLTRPREEQMKIIQQQYLLEKQREDFERRRIREQMIQDEEKELRARRVVVMNFWTNYANSYGSKNNQSLSNQRSQSNELPEEFYKTLAIVGSPYKSPLLNRRRVGET